MRLSILPEHHTVVGKPGIAGGHRDGGDWSPLFTTTTLTVDGTEHRSGLVAVGAGAVRVAAHDTVADLGLVLDIELLPSGLLRTRAEVTNVGDSFYVLDDLQLAFPVPPQAREILDFAGRWGEGTDPAAP